MKKFVLFLVLLGCVSKPSMPIKRQNQERPQTKINKDDRRRPEHNQKLLVSQNNEKKVLPINENIQDFQPSAKPVKVDSLSFPTNEPYTRIEEAATPSQQIQVEIPKQDYIEILVPQKKVSNFVISTSPTYKGIALEEARQILEKFGIVRAVRENEKFSLKVDSKNGLQTEEDAKRLMKEIIAASFFDIYLEKLN